MALYSNFAELSSPTQTPGTGDPGPRAPGSPSRPRHPDIIRKLKSLLARRLWYFLYFESDEWGRLELNLTVLAEEWGTSRKTLHKHLQRFRRWRLITILRSFNGPGQGVAVSVTWKAKAKRWEAKPLFFNSGQGKVARCNPIDSLRSLKQLDRHPSVSLGGEQPWVRDPDRRRRWSFEGVDPVFSKKTFGYKRINRAFRYLFWEKGLPKAFSNATVGMLAERLEGKPVDEVKRVYRLLEKRLGEWSMVLREKVKQGVRAVCGFIWWLISSVRKKAVEAKQRGIRRWTCRRCGRVVDSLIEGFCSECYWGDSSRPAPSSSPAVRSSTRARSTATSSRS